MATKRVISFKELIRMLRHQGIFALSPLATRAVIAAAVLAYLLGFGRHHLTNSVRMCRQLWGDPLSIEHGLPGLFGLLQELGQCVIATTLSACLTGIIVCMMQSGFFFSPGMLLRRRRQRSTHEVSGFGVFGLPLGIAGGIWILSRFLMDILLLLRQEVSRVISMMEVLWVEIAKSVIVVALVLAILAWVGARIRFAVRNRNAGQHGSSHG